MDEEKLATQKEPVIRVRVVKQEKAYALVEEVSTLKRVSVPVEKIEVLQDGLAVRQSIFEGGIGYGVDWEGVALPKVTSENLAFELRRHGLHTADEVMKQPGQVAAALRAAYGPVLGTLLEFCKRLL